MKLSEDLTCAELVELVTDYLEGAMPASDRDRFEQHLVFCRGCSAHLDQVRTTVTLTGRLGEDDLAPATRDDLLLTFRDWKRRS